MESAYGEDDSTWPSAGLDGDLCISRDCRDIDGGVTLLSNEERRAQLQGKVISAPSASACSRMANLPRCHCELGFPQVEDLKKDRLRKAEARDRFARFTLCRP